MIKNQNQKLECLKNISSAAYIKRIYALMTLFALAVLPGTVGADPVNLIPNGSFEFWTRFSTECLKNNADKLWEPDPGIPVRWAFNVQKGAAVKQSKDAKSGSFAAELLPGTRLWMRTIEVLPGIDYSYGITIRGNGHVRVWVDSSTIEGNPYFLSDATTNASPEWKEIGGTFKVPPHIRWVTLTIEVNGKGSVILDNVHISAELEQPYDADAILREPYKADKDTIFFENFDGAKPAFQTTTPNLIRVTDEKGGRFGRGLRVDPISAAMFPLEMKAMPPSGR